MSWKWLIFTLLLYSSSYWVFRCKFSLRDLIDFRQRVSTGCMEQTNSTGV